VRGVFCCFNILLTILVYVLQGVILVVVELD